MAKSFKLTKNQIDILLNENKKKLLNEITSSIIYHWASPKTAEKILNNNRFSLMSTLFKNAESSLLGTSHKHMYYLSMTRNGKIGQGGYSNAIHPWVRLTLNGDLLNANFHIKALDYWGASMGKNARFDPKYKMYDKIQKPGSETESEDRLYAKEPFIENAYKYIEKIDIYFDINNTYDQDVYDYNLQCVQNIMYMAHKKCALYTTVEDFNNHKNSMSFDEFADFTRHYKTNSSLSIDNGREKKIPADFLASIVYLVNFPNGNFKDCINTLNQYGLRKYAKIVSNEIQKPSSWKDPYPFNITKWKDRTDKQVRAIIRELIQKIEIANDGQSKDREDLAKAFKILTDFCSKHKLNNYADIENYLTDVCMEGTPKFYGDANSTVDVQCVKNPFNEKIYLCVNPSVCYVKTVFDNGEDVLRWAKDDIVNYVENHKSSSNEKFKNYINRLLIKGNPTIQDLINLYDKLENLGNEIDPYCKPILFMHTLDFWNFNDLLNNSNYGIRDIDGNQVYLSDDTQRKLLISQIKEKNNM